MTVTRLAAVGGTGAGGRRTSWGGVGPRPVRPGPRGPCPRRPQWPHPLLNVAGSGGRGLAAHAGGVHRLGGDEVQVLVVRDLV